MLTIDHLVKTFEGDRGERIQAVDDVSFEVSDGQLFTLLGPSGCGKTTTLRSIAGLEHPDSGTIRLADRVLFSRRQVAPRCTCRPTSAGWAWSSSRMPSGRT